MKTRQRAFQDEVQLLTWPVAKKTIHSSRTTNELQHATRWRPLVVAQCKRGLNNITVYVISSSYSMPIRCVYHIHEVLC